MSGIFKKIAAYIVAIIKAFFGISDSENLASGSKKVATIVLGRIFFIIADYWAVIASVALVSTLKYRGCDFLEILAATWLYDLIVAVAFLIISIRSGQDITLGESFRRAADVIHNSNKLMGYTTSAFLIVKATIWDGPEQVPIFFKKELKKFSRMILLLLFLTAFQGAFWAYVYSLGYDSVAELIKSFK